MSLVSKIIIKTQYTRLIYYNDEEIYLEWDENENKWIAIFNIIYQTNFVITFFVSKEDTFEINYKLKYYKSKYILTLDKYEFEDKYFLTED